MSSSSEKNAKTLASRCTIIISEHINPQDIDEKLDLIDQEMDAVLGQRQYFTTNTGPSDYQPDLILANSPSMHDGYTTAYH